MKKRRRAAADYRLQGIAAALAELARAHIEPDMARAAGADAYDLEPFKQ
jgi:hypothetical protein